MRGAARRLVRWLAYLGLRTTRRVGSFSKKLAVASLTPPEFDALAVKEWEAFGDSSTNEDLLFPWETEFFAAHIRPGDTILVAGAGAGRDVLPLIASGHDVTALDMTPRALETLKTRAGKRSLKVQTIVASIVTAPLPRSSFDVVLFSWFMYSYVRSREERVTSLRRAAAALRPQGRLLLSYVVRQHPGTTAGRFSISFSRLVARVVGGIEPNPGDHMEFTGTARDPRAFYSHAFTREEIESEARDAGLRIIEHGEVPPSVGKIALSL